MNLTMHPFTCRRVHVLLILSCSLFYYVPGIALAASNDQDDSSLVTFMDGKIAIQLSTIQVELVDFKVQILDSIHYQPQQAATGKVVNIQPLLELSSRLQTITIKLNNSRIKEQIAHADLQRAQQLAADGITSAARIAKLKQVWLTQLASQQELQTQINFLKLGASQQWGKPLAQAIINNSPLFSKLSTRQSSLLLITVPSSLSDINSVRIIEISTDGGRMNTFSAKLLSASPINNYSAGNNYFFITANNNLAVDTRLTAWIPEHENSSEGVLIPESAIIWHNAKPWIYVQLNNRLFVRYPLGTHHLVNNHWFVDDPYLGGKRVVISGSAVLLSEELRSQIPDEDDE